MAAKSKNRLVKTQNKLLEYDKMQLRDVICSICQSILLEPVTLPCLHNFCQSCFKSSIENNALCCPLCRLRIGSWLRTTTKQNKLVNIKLWDVIKTKFANEVNIKLQGEDLNLSQEQAAVCLSAPGEIRAEYEAELKRLQAERLQQEQKQLEKTTILIKKIQEEEDETHKKYLGILKQDEILAKKVQEENNKEHSKRVVPNYRHRHTLAPAKPRLKTAKIEAFLTKTSTSYKVNPLLIDDSTNSSNGSDFSPVKNETRGSPEIVPSYGKFLKNILDKKIRNISGVWNKENGDNSKTKKTDELPHANNSFSPDEKDSDKTLNATQSLPVSLPYTGILQHKMNTVDKRSAASGSVDSMRQELCYFKPVQGTTATSYNAKRGFPLRVPVVRLEKPEAALVYKEAPTQMQYVEGLCLLRNHSLEHNLPSAFVIALTKGLKSQSDTKANLSTKGNSVAKAVTGKNISSKSKNCIQLDGIDKLNKETSLRRTRSTGSLSKAENETTPKKTKAKARQVVSERKPYLRSESKKNSAKKEINGPPFNSDSVNNNKVNLAVKNLSSPLQHCDVKKIFEEQLRIVKQMEQEKKDLELARKMDLELNRRLLRRAPAADKRALPPQYALRPPKKLKV
ncbi:E3 ubiquitin-protein ligase RNF169-like [Leguminivora glycinivorella]|uniref:E3 ubiquitin-protein ligase RNF169-like n=1 Tax=Leguminivora glycinivorella TaxID=1035111 RepID=UPI00200FA361|nr:E3 ubiquitin-protein ligase RNF169-like [Leguminivora glycinivorella]